MQFSSLLAFVLVLPTVWAKDPAVPLIHINLYNRVDLSPDYLNRAIRITSRVFEEAGVRLVIKHCLLPGGEYATPRCREARGVLSMGLIPVDDRDSSAPQVLGFAIKLRDCRHAAVIWPKVKDFARSLGADADVILGYAIAHELFHLIVPDAPHTRGLMRAAWETSDATDMAQGQMWFSDEDVEKMRQQLETGP